MGKVNFIDPSSGIVYAIDEADTDRIRQAVADQWVPETPEATAHRTIAGRVAEDYDTTGDHILGGMAAVGRGATAGLSDVVVRGLGGREAAYGLARQRESIGGWATPLEIAGAIIPTVASGGAGAAGAVARVTPAGLISRAGAAVMRAPEGAGLLVRGGRLVAGGAVEGALTEVGAGVSDLALADDPLTMERVAGTLSSRALYGGAFGGGAAGAIGGLGAGLGYARKKLVTAREALEAGPDVGGDLAQLDRKGLRAAEEAELAAIEAGRVPQRQQLADEFASLRESSKVSRPWDAVATGSKETIAKARKVAGRAEKAAVAAEAEVASLSAEIAEAEAKAAARGGVRAPGWLDDQLAKAQEAAATARAAAVDAASEVAMLSTKAPRWMREYGARALKADRELDRILNDPKALSGAAGERAFNSASAGAASALRKQEAALSDILAKADELKVIHATDRTGRRAKALDAVTETLERNRALQARIADLTAAPTSQRLASIKDAVDALANAPKTSLGGSMASGAAYSMTSDLVRGIPLVGNLLAPMLGARVADAVSGKLGPQLLAATRQAAERTTKAVDAFLTVTKGSQKVAPKLAAIAASKVLEGARFAPEAATKAAPKKPTLDESFDARAGELAASVVTGADGRPVVREHVRTRIHDGLSGLAAVAPHVADRLETHAVRRLEFLAAKLPRRPVLGMTMLRPSELEVRAFARYLAAADDPGGIEERLADGTVTPEDAEVMRELYPERLAAITASIIERLPELRASLPYHRRLALSFITGVPVDAAMEPHILASLQAQYVEEPDTAGGTEAPRPRPAFGSVRKSVPNPTPAQLRAGGSGAIA